MSSISGQVDQRFIPKDPHLSPPSEETLISKVAIEALSNRSFEALASLKQINVVQDSESFALSLVMNTLLFLPFFKEVLEGEYREKSLPLKIFLNALKNDIFDPFSHNGKLRSKTVLRHIRGVSFDSCHHSVCQSMENILKKTSQTVQFWEFFSFLDNPILEKSVLPAITCYDNVFLFPIVNYLLDENHNYLKTTEEYLQHLCRKSQPSCEYLCFSKRDVSLKILPSLQIDIGHDSFELQALITSTQALLVKEDNIYIYDHRTCKMVEEGDLYYDLLDLIEETEDLDQEIKESSEPFFKEQPKLFIYKRKNEVLF